MNCDARRRWRKAVGAGLLGLSTSCSSLGSIDRRAKDLNEVTGSYQASAILLNILRASEAEPLNFVSLTGVTGHNTFTAGLGLPAISIGPDRTPTQRLLIFGPNAISGSTSNDFNVSVLDDPQSQTALSRPVDSDTLGFLIHQDNNIDHVLLLFVSKIELRDNNGDLLCLCSSLDKTDANRQPLAYSQVKVQACSRSGSKRSYGSFLNEPISFNSVKGEFEVNTNWENEFYQVINHYIDAGLSVVTDPAFVPSSKADTSKGKFCFDPTLVDTDVFEHSLQFSPGQECRPISSNESPARISQPSGEEQTGKALSFPDPLRQGVNVFVSTRSVNGAYRFLGELVRRDRMGGFKGFTPPSNVARADLVAGSDEAKMLLISPDHSGCWTSVDYEGKSACVPRDAFSTKHTFQMLHQLFELYTTPNNAPVTSTVRTVQ